MSSTSTFQKAETTLTKVDKLIEDAKKGNKSSDKMTRALTQVYQMLLTFDGAAEINPIAKAVVKTAEGVIQAELQRHSNDVKIAEVAILLGKMTLTVHRLIEIYTEQHYADNLTKSFDRVDKTIEEFGQFCVMYYDKARYKIVRFLRANEFKDKLCEYADAFARFQLDVHGEVLLRTAKSQKQATTNIEIIMRETRNIRHVLSMPDVTDQAEKNGLAFIQNHGGVNAILENSTVLEELAKILGESVTLSVKNMLHATFAEMMAESRVIFELNLTNAKREIQISIDRSSTVVLAKLDEGLHTLIKDPQLRRIWKENRWKTSIEYRIFMDAFCSDSFRNSSHAEDDRWTIPILSKVSNHFRIGEAIDDDSSGFISIFEVNEFMDRKPGSWSTPLWLTFWALGSQYLAWAMTESVAETGLEIRSACESVIAVLSSKQGTQGCIGTIREYLRTWDMLDIWASWAEDDDVAVFNNDNRGVSSQVMEMSDELAATALEHMDEQWKRLNYHISVENRATVRGLTDRVFTQPEQYIPFMLSIVAEHQENIISGLSAENIISHDQIEWIQMTFSLLDNALTCIVALLHERMLDIIGTCKAQRIDVETHVMSCGGGIFSSWYTEYSNPTSLNKFLDQYILARDQYNASIYGSNAIRRIAERLDRIETKLGYLATGIEGPKVDPSPMQVVSTNYDNTNIAGARGVEPNIYGAPTFMNGTTSNAQIQDTPQYGNILPSVASSRLMPENHGYEYDTNALANNAAVGDFTDGHQYVQPDEGEYGGPAYQLHAHQEEESVDTYGTRSNAEDEYQDGGLQYDQEGVQEEDAEVEEDQVDQWDEDEGEEDPDDGFQDDEEQDEW